MSFINLDNVTITFPDGTIGLHDASFSVEKGEFIALVGPSGSGKTTLLRTIAGFVIPSSGTVSVDGKDLTNVPPEKRGMGMVFQQHAVWPHMSVAKNVEYPLVQLKLEKDERKKAVTRILETVGLAGFENRKPASLSGGQRQRVALARAVVADPSVLLLDEALSALDEPLRDSLRRELVSLAKTQNLTTIHVTHDRSEALSIADRVVVLIDGHIEQIAEPHELVSRPATAEVASFITDATLIDATVSNGSVTSDELNITFDLADVVTDSLPDGPATLAITPTSTTITTAGSPDSIPATITSVLFDSEKYSVTVDIESGKRFRSEVAGPKPAVGDNVGLVITKPLVFGSNHSRINRTAVSN